MIGDPRSARGDPERLESILRELERALDGMRGWLRAQERSVSRPAHAQSIAEPGPRERDLLAVVEEILAIPASGLELPELYTLATDHVARLVGADRVMVLMAEGEHLRARSARGFRRDDLPSIVLQRGDGIVGRAFEERRVVRRAGERPAAPDSFIDRFPVAEAIAVPVRARDDVVGVLYAGRARGSRFGDTDVLPLLVLADRIGGALVHQGLLDRRSAHLARLEELAQFARDAPVGRDVPDILSRACEIGCRLIGVRAAAAAVGVEDLEVIASRGVPRGSEAGRSVSRRQGLTAEVYATDGPVACRDLQTRRAAERSFLGDAGFRGCLLLPLRVRDLVLGVLYLADTDVRDFSPEEIEAARVLAAVAAAAIENSQVHGRLVVALDEVRSEQRHVLDVEQARAVGDVAEGLAREFNQVFAVILGRSQLLLARAPDDPVREGLALIEEAAWRGADVVRRLGGLVLSAADASATTDVRPLVQEMVALARTRSQKSGPRVVDVVADLHSVPPVRGTEAALREVVGHVLRNAMDAMPDGGRLGVTLRTREGGVELIVDDTGEGTTDDVRRRMFDPFFTTRGPGRIGLGLTVVRNTVARCGGRVDAAPNADRGTTVVVWLPAAPRIGESPSVVVGPSARVDLAVAMPGESPSLGPVAPARPESATILVLEDEEPVRSTLVEALTRAGYEVHWAADGTEGLAKVESGHFDVVLTDLALPQRSGLAIARSIKRASPGTRVVLMTAWGHLLDPGRLSEHGVDVMLVKPFRPERAVSIVADALRARPSP